MFRGSKAADSLSSVVKSGAVRLLDDAEARRITAPMTSPEATFEPTARDERSQGFYRQEVVVGGGGPYVRLVDALSGECLSQAGSTIELRPCGSSGQNFLEHGENLNGWDRYQLPRRHRQPRDRRQLDHALVHAVDRRCRPALPMWLAPY